MQRVLNFVTSLLAFQSPFKSRESINDLDWKYMRASIATLPSPCYSQAFGSVIVNATSRELLCDGFNKIATTGDPTEHGEINAIRNCVHKFMKAGYTSAEIQKIWEDAWIYTTAEPCPMCATTILHSGFKRVIFATSGIELYKMGWTASLTTVSMQSMAERAALQPGFGAGRPITTVVPGIAANETEALFRWQWQSDADCPSGCHREEGWCAVD